MLPAPPLELPLNRKRKIRMPATRTAAMTTTMRNFLSEKSDCFWTGARTGGRSVAIIEPGLAGLLFICLLCCVGSLVSIGSSDKI